MYVYSHILIPSPDFCGRKVHQRTARRQLSPAPPVVAPHPLLGDNTLTNELFKGNLSYLTII